VTELEVKENKQKLDGYSCPSSRGLAPRGGWWFPRVKVFRTAKSSKREKKETRKRDTKRQIKTGGADSEQEIRERHIRALSQSLSLANRMSSLRSISRDANTPAKTCTCLALLRHL